MRTSAGSRRHLSSSPFKPAEAPVAVEYAVDERVTHDKYGLGRVVEVHSDVAVVVDFGSTTVRITTPFTKLSKL